MAKNIKYTDEFKKDAISQVINRGYSFAMKCSLYLRKRVIDFVRGGGNKEETALRFQVSRASVTDGFPLMTV